MKFKTADGTSCIFLAKKVTVAQTANGVKYTRFSISQKNGTSYEYCNVFVWKELPLQENDKVIIKNISAVSTKTYVNKMNSTSVATNIYAEADIIAKASDQPINIQGDAIPDFSEKLMPF